MTIALTSERFTFNDHASSGNVVSGSFTPAADTLLLYIFYSTDGITDVTGHEGGGDWVEIIDDIWDTNRHMVVWACITGSSPSAGTVTISKPYNWNVSASLMEISGVDTSGSVADCFGQIGTVDEGYDVRVHTVTLAAFADKGNATFWLACQGGASDDLFMGHERPCTHLGGEASNGGVALAMYDGERNNPFMQIDSYVRSAFNAFELIASSPVANPDMWYGNSTIYFEDWASITIGDVAAYARSAQFTTTSAGTINSMWAMLRRDVTDGERVGLFLYDDTTGDLLDSSTVRTDVNSTAGEWYEFTGWSYDLEDATTYLAVALADTQSVDIGYLTDAPVDGWISDGGDWTDVDAVPDPGSFVIETNAYDHQIYVEYTPAAAAAQSQAVKFAVGQTTVPATATIVNCNVAGFGEPVAAIFWLSRAVTVGTSLSEMSFGYGFTVGVSASDRSTAIQSRHNVTTSETHRSMQQGHCIHILDDADPAIVLTEADWNQWNTDGVQLDFTTVSGNQEILNFLLIGGSDAVASIGYADINGPATSVRNYAHSLGEEPVLAFTAGTTANTNGVSDHLAHFFGVIVNQSDVITQRNLASWMTDAYAGTQTGHCFHEGRSMGTLDASAISRMAECTGIDATNMEFTHRGPQDYDMDAQVLAIGFGSATNRIEMGQVNSPAATGIATYHITDDWQPQFIMLGQMGVQIVDQVDTTNNEGMTFGIIDANNEYSMSFTMHDSQSTSANKVLAENTALSHLTGAGTSVSLEGSILTGGGSIGGDRFIVDWTTTPGSNRKGFWLAVEQDQQSAVLVQSQAADGTGGSFGVAFDSDVTAGNMIVVAASSWESSPPGSHTISDTQTNTYESPVGGGVAGGENRTEIHYAMNVAGGATTVNTVAGGDDRAIVIMEFSGVKTTGAFDTAAWAEGTSTSPETAAINPTGDNLYIGAFTHVQNSPTTTVDSPFTKVSSEISSWTYSPLFCSYYSGIGSQTPAGEVVSASGVWGASGATFNLAADEGIGGSTPTFYIRRHIGFRYG